MKSGWFDRLIEAVAADARSARELSRAMGVGDNFVQQMVKNRKEPSVSKIDALLDILGPAATAYVRTGMRVGDDEEEFVRAVLAVPPHLRKHVRQLLEDIAAADAARAPSDPGQDPATKE